MSTFSFPGTPWKSHMAPLNLHQQLHYSGLKSPSPLRAFELLKQLFLPHSRRAKSSAHLLNTALALESPLQLPVQVEMFAKPKNLHNSSFQKLCLRHQNIALHGLSLEFHPLGAENWIHFCFGAPHVYLKWFQGEFGDLFLSHPLQRLHHQMPLL